MKHTGKTLKQMRTNRGLTQSQLAEKLGISRGAVSQHESAVHSTTSVINKWAVALGYDWEIVVKENII